MAPERTDGSSTVAILASAGGVLFFLLAVVATGPFETVGVDSATASASEIAAYYEENGVAIRAYTILWTAGWAAFVLFLAALYARLRVREPHLAMVAFGSGLVLSLLHVLGEMVGGALAFEAAGSVQPEAMVAWYAMSKGLTNLTVELATFVRGLFLMAVGWGALRGRIMPAWLAWVALVLGGLSWLAGFGLATDGTKQLVFIPGYGAYIVSFFWVLVASLVLVWRTLRGRDTVIGAGSDEPTPMA